jgi:hypothetical protein
VTPPRRRYAADLTDRKWALLAPTLGSRHRGYAAVADESGAMMTWWHFLPERPPSEPSVSGAGLSQPPDQLVVQCRRLL